MGVGCLPTAEGAEELYVSSARQRVIAWSMAEL